MSLDVEVVLDGRTEEPRAQLETADHEPVAVHVTWLGEGVHRLRAAAGPQLAVGATVALHLDDGTVLRGTVHALDARAGARRRGHAPRELSERAQRLEQLLKARGLDPMRVHSDDAGPLDELVARGRAIEVEQLGEHLHADRLDELVDLRIDDDPERLATLLRCSVGRAAALLATARDA